MIFGRDIRAPHCAPDQLRRLVKFERISSTQVPSTKKLRFLNDSHKIGFTEDPCIIPPVRLLCENTNFILKLSVTGRYGVFFKSDTGKQIGLVQFVRF